VSLPSLRSFRGRGPPVRPPAGPPRPNRKGDVPPRIPAVVIGSETESEVRSTWEFFLSRESYVVQAFALAVTGIGALFFAYGQIGNLHLRIVVSATGLGASTVLWLHCFASLKDRDGAVTILKATPSGRRLLARYQQITGWRGVGLGRWLYVSVTLAVTYFSALLGLAWLLILSSDLLWATVGRPIPWMLDEIVITIATVGALLLIVYRKARANHEWRAIAASAGESGESG